MLDRECHWDRLKNRLYRNVAMPTAAFNHPFNKTVDNGKQQIGKVFIKAVTRQLKLANALASIGALLTIYSGFVSLILI